MQTNRDHREKEFLALAERFRNSEDEREVKELGEQLGRSIFGE